LTPIIDQIERQYAELVRKLESGQIDEATFEAEAERLQFQDQEGRIWALGARTGRWYVYTDQGWVLSNPPRPKSPQKAPEAPSRVPFSKYWLGLAIAGGILLACLLVGAGSLALWQVSLQTPASPPPAAPTEPPQAPAFTPVGELVWVTATPRPATATATSSPTWAPTATPTVTDTPLPLPTPSSTWTSEPTQAPTTTPTLLPSLTPTSIPTTRPTTTPTPLPTQTEAPTPTATEAATAATVASATPTRTPLPPTPTDTPQPQLAGRILYPVYTEGSAWYDIYIQSVEGGDRQWLVGQASQPAASADGQWLAFRSWQADDRGLRVISMGGNEKRRVTDRLEDGLPAWSPDGTSIIFSSRRVNDRIDRINAVSPYGGEVRTLKRDYKPVYGLDPAWLPDGRIVYKAIHGLSGLYLMNSDGGGAQQLIGDASAAAPAVSPDGNTIAFMSQRDGNWEIYQIGTDGSGLRRLTDHPAADGLPTWSPDGQWLAFVSNRDGEWAVWAMDSQSTSLQRLFPLQGSPGGLVRGEPDFSSKGWTEEQIQWLP